MGQGEATKGSDQICLISKSEDCVSESIAMDKEDQSILHLSTDDGLSDN